MQLKWIKAPALGEHSLSRQSLFLALGCAWLIAWAAPAQAALQFDVFLGYDGAVREAGWFPVACEVHNDGPSFNAVFELTAGNIGADQVRRVPIELPTNTRKRFVIPVFASGGRFYQWDARLLDERGKVQAEHLGLQPRVVPWEGVLVGALARSFAGVPVLPDTQPNRPDIKPHVARLQVEQFPDNPIALESLNAVYLNSEKALSLRVNQVSALLAWVHGGGHLIVSVEQLGDVNSTPWLQQLLPSDVTEMVNVTVEDDLTQWLQKTVDPGSQWLPREAPVRYGPGARPPSRPGRMVRPGTRPAQTAANPFELLAPDPNFLDAQMPVATGRARDGEVVLAANNVPLVIEAHRGRGRITLLTFSPEREPFRSWKHRPLFFSKLLNLPPAGIQSSGYGGWSLDGVFGALIDSRQIRKLPVEWLLLLLLVYLVVIGPFDQYWLKKINRQMLTWITFPAYVVVFSLLIYFIGYKLRAGETEWNELQVVDVLPRGDAAALRGRTFASIYSSGNAKYQLAFSPPFPDAADQTYASLRGELLSLNSGGREASRANLEQAGNVFRAEIFVPVWTSLLYVNDWFQPGDLPLTASLTNRQGQTALQVENLLERPLTDARVVFQGSVYELGTLPAGKQETFPLEPGSGVSLQAWILQHSGLFQNAVQSRRTALGDERRGQLENLPLTSMVASFSAPARADSDRNFVAPWGLDLTELIDRGDAVLLAWDANGSYTRPVNQFQPPLLRRNTLLRLAVAAPSQTTPERP